MFKSKAVLMTWTPESRLTLLAFHRAFEDYQDVIDKVEAHVYSGMQSEVLGTVVYQCIQEITPECFEWWVETEMIGDIENMLPSLISIGGKPKLI